MRPTLPSRTLRLKQQKPLKLQVRSVHAGRYTETNTGPARSITHVCTAKDNAEATSPCNHQYAMSFHRVRLEKG